MRAPDRKPVSDQELDTLLGSRFRDTSPEFEARWVDFKRRLRTGPPARHALPPWAAWLGFMSAGVALLALLLTLHPWRPVPLAVPAPPPDLDALFAMDAVLSPATALLDTENRDALLNLPATPSPHT